MYKGRISKIGKEILTKAEVRRRARAEYYAVAATLSRLLRITKSFKRRETRRTPSRPVILINSKVPIETDRC